MRAAIIAIIILTGAPAMSQTIESKDAKLTGAPMPEQQFSYTGHPVSSAVAYGMSQGNSNIISPFSDAPIYKPYNTKLLREAVLRAAKAIIENPDKKVWSVQTRDGMITLFVGDYGNVNASLHLGAIEGTNAAKADPAYVNGTMADYNAVNRERGKPEEYIGAEPQPLITSLGSWKKWFGGE